MVWAVVYMTCQKFASIQPLLSYVGTVKWWNFGRASGSQIQSTPAVSESSLTCHWDGVWGHCGITCPWPRNGLVFNTRYLIPDVFTNEFVKYYAEFKFDVFAYRRWKRSLTPSIRCTRRHESRSRSGWAWWHVVHNAPSYVPGSLMTSSRWRRNVIQRAPSCEWMLLFVLHFCHVIRIIAFIVSYSLRNCGNPPICNSSLRLYASWP